MDYNEVIEQGDLVEFSGEYYCQGIKKWVWSSAIERGMVVSIRYEKNMPIEDTPSRIITILSADKQLIDVYADKSYASVRKALQ